MTRDDSADHAAAHAVIETLGEVDGLAQLSFLVHGTLERRAAEHELSIAQVRLLGILRDRKPTMYQLAQLLGLDKSSTTGLVDRAERRGLVQRQPSSRDRREIHVSLTRHGRRLITLAATAFGTEVNSLLEPLSDAERAVLLKIIRRVLWADAQGRGLDPALVLGRP